LTFIHDDFLLETKAARRLYHQYASHQPIIDYHCHLPPRDVADDRQFANLFEIWLEGDHYKWRAMRASGVPERYCTGDADPLEKFQAWAKTVPHCLRNPLYHWTHLELKRYFGIEDFLNERTASSVWARANEQLTSPTLSAKGILGKFCVRAVCTTDDPADPLTHHENIAASGLATKVYPTFRADRVMDPHQPAVFNPWVDKLSATANIHIGQLPDLLDALRKRHQAFHDIGGRLSDHGLDQCYAAECSDQQARSIFLKARGGASATPEEREAFASYMMVYFGHLDAERGWTKQLHLGARRNANTRAFNTLGRDVGYDSIGDLPQIEALGRYLDRLERENALPKTIVYNLNPRDNYAFASMIGNFQDGSVTGKIQFGSGWWFLDQKEAMEWQLNALSNNGLLAHFVGMLTDSRSFMSYPRHEYFRRVLCNLLGREMENGELPADEEMIGGLVEKVCYKNAERHFGLTLAS
jgi:glucuronate isomerase